MTGTGPDGPRSLIIVSGDPAELTHAMLFARGQAFASRAVIMLPRDLHELHGGALPMAALPYASVDDIQRAADEHQPELLLLFSGYTLTINSKIPVSALDALLNRQRERGCRLATSDPFLGLLPSLTAADTDTTLLAPDHPALARWLIRAVVRLRGRVIDLPRLDDATHLYPTSIPARNDGLSRASFFNPGLVQPASAAPDTPPSWLFTLTPLESACQELLLGAREFTEILLRMLRYALEVEARPTLIGPKPIVDRLRPALPGQVELLAGCPLPDLEQRMLAAEYQFTWDPFSPANLLRLVNELPVFPVDRGYFTRVITPFYAVARDCHFAGWEPNVQDQRQLFSTYVLSHLAKTQREALHAARERWKSSPSPDTVVANIMAKDPKAAPA